MLARSFRYWLIGALGFTVAVWGIGMLPSAALRAQDGSPVNISPRPKPAPKEEILPKANIRSDVNLVLIPVTVTDPLNRFVTGSRRSTSRFTRTRNCSKFLLFRAMTRPFRWVCCSIAAAAWGPNSEARERL